MKVVNKQKTLSVLRISAKKFADNYMILKEDNYNENNQNRNI